jgi:ATP-binding cassette subfamily B protein
MTATVDDTPSDTREHGSEDEDGSLVEHAPTVPLPVIFRRFWPYTREFRGRMVASLLLTGAVPALSTASIYLYKVLIDDVLTPHDFGPFPLVAALYLGITLVSGVVTWIDEYLTAWVGERFVLGLRVDLFTHLQRLSLGFFERRQLGDIMSRLGGDVGEIETLVLTGVNMALTYVFQIVLFTGMLFYLDWQLALAALVAAPGFLLVARLLSGRIRSAARDLRRRSGSIGAVAEESLSNLALVQAYDRQADETARYRRENQGAFAAQMVAVRLEALFGPLSSLVEVVGVLLVMGFAVWELANGRITLGELLVFVAYISQLYGPVAGFGGLWNEMSSAKAGAERIIEMLDQEPAVVDPVDPAPLGRARGALAVRGVSFTYPDTERPALAGVDVTIAPGEKVAVVGASGAGKTTLTKLLLRFYDPDAGQVTLDGRDIREVSLSDLRRNVGAVLQETLVFDGTIAENIRWGRPDATDEEVEQAARAADVHRFATELPDGYATRVGQRGRLLSGGQRQRLAIARAMIRDAPVLLLDEPTTGLDAESSERVLRPLRTLMAGRTTLMISHNLLTVTDADRILFLEDGRVSAVGSHRELLAGSPGYARLYRLHQPGSQPAPSPFRRTRAVAPADLPVPPVPAGAAPSEPSAAETATVRMRLPLVAPGPRKGPRHLRDTPVHAALRSGGPRPGGRHRAPERNPVPAGPEAPRPSDRPRPSPRPLPSAYQRSPDEAPARDPLAGSLGGESVLIDALFLDQRTAEDSSADAEPATQRSRAVR